jgi:coatomer subunit beta
VQACVEAGGDSASKGSSKQGQYWSLVDHGVILQLGQSSYLPHPIDNDSYDRIVLCLRLLCNTGDDVRKVWLKSCLQSFVNMLAEKQFRETEEMKAKAQITYAQPPKEQEGETDLLFSFFLTLIIISLSTDC